jgi:hypothetical protein
MDIDACILAMQEIYRRNPQVAVRGQSFIKMLHSLIASDLRARLTPSAIRSGIQVKEEVTVYGSHKPKDVDVGVIDPSNGPLMLVGVRSQMSSIGKNALTYYEGIVGECISIQDRFPMAVTGYVYLHPMRPIMEGRELERVDHVRFARMYEAITGRTGLGYKSIRGIYDQFAYMVVDFDASPPVLNRDLIRTAVPDTDLDIETFVDRLVSTFKKRHLFLNIFN